MLSLILPLLDFVSPSFLASCFLHCPSRPLPPPSCQLPSLFQREGVTEFFLVARRLQPLLRWVFAIHLEWLAAIARVVCHHYFFYILVGFTCYYLCLLLSLKMVMRGGLDMEEVGAMEKPRRSEEGGGLGVPRVHHTKWVYWYFVLFLAIDFYFIYIEWFRSIRCMVHLTSSSAP